jgi:hypothetical protein
MSPRTKEYYRQLVSKRIRATTNNNYPFNVEFWNFLKEILDETPKEPYNTKLWKIIKKVNINSDFWCSRDIPDSVFVSTQSPTACLYYALAFVRKIEKDSASARFGNLHKIQRKLHTSTKKQFDILVEMLLRESMAMTGSVEKFATGQCLSIPCVSITFFIEALKTFCI